MGKIFRTEFQIIKINVRVVHEATEIARKIIQNQRRMIFVYHGIQLPQLGHRFFEKVSKFRFGDDQLELFFGQSIFIPEPLALGLGQLRQFIPQAVNADILSFQTAVDRVRGNTDNRAPPLWNAGKRSFAALRSIRAFP